jgi:hypothetical protein
MVSVRVNGPKVCGYKPGRGEIFKSDKNPQHAFLRRGSKDGGPMSQDFILFYFILFYFILFYFILFYFIYFLFLFPANVPGQK